MQSRFHIDYGMKHLIVKTTYKTDLPIELSRIRPLRYTNSIQSDAESVHPDADAELEKRPKWAKTTLKDAVDLVGDPADTRRTRYDL
jgi:hypothetical protein